jgi:octanoyl-[GcvH]:protein N-octanoyltransferase
VNTTAAPWQAGSVQAARSTLLGGVDRLFVAADSDLGSAAADLAVGPALLRTVARTPSTGWLRMYRPVPTVGFSRRDTKAANYSGAVSGAWARGFEPAVRSPGGRAAAYHRSSLCFELVLPDAGERNPVEQISALGDLVAGILRDLGVDARVGEVPGEYCPGRFSINAGGVAKIVGTAGRRVRGAILLGGSIIVADADPIRAVLSEVYPALALTMDPATVAAAADVGCTVDDAEAIGDVLLSALAPPVRVSLAPLPTQVVAEAHAALDDRPMVG